LEKAVREFHALGILHRDIKPANIFLRKDTWIPCIFDFSDALYLSNESVQSPQSEYVGSPKYSHPHILHQKISFYPIIFRPEYDMYAIGIILKDDIVPRVRRNLDRQEVMLLANYFLDSKQWT
jgi:serine/threonine protein kinase